MKPLPEQVQIRRMAVADLDQVLAIAASLPAAPHWPQSAYINALNLESTPRRITLVAAGPRPDTVQCFTVASVLPPQAELETIAVAPGSQRRGLGRRLFRALADELLTGGAREILLEVRASNQAAIAFYRCLGFSETGRRKRYYADPIEDAVLMHFLLD